MADINDVLNGLSEQQRARLVELTGIQFPSSVPSTQTSTQAPMMPLAELQSVKSPMDRSALEGNVAPDAPVRVEAPREGWQAGGLQMPSKSTFDKLAVLGQIPDAAGIGADDLLSKQEQKQIITDADVRDPMDRLQRFNERSAVTDNTAPEVSQELPPVPRPTSSEPTPSIGASGPTAQREQSPMLGLIEDFQGAANREKEALNTQAIKTAELETARSAMLHAEATRQEDRAKEQRLLNERRQFDQNVALAKLEQAQQAYEKADINPGQWWDTRSDGQKFGVVVAAMLGSLGSALSKGPNYAMQMINQHISNDILAQRTKLSKMGDVVSKRRNALQDLRDQFGDEDAAALALENIKLQGVKLELDKQLADTSSQLKIAQGTEMVAKIDKQVAENTIKLATIIDENSRANFLADLQAQKLAAAQQAAAGPRPLTETAGVIMNVFRGDTKRQNAALKELGAREAYNSETAVVLNAARKLKDIKARYGELIPGTNASREWDQQVSIITSTLQRNIKGSASDKDIERMLGLIPNKLSTDSAVDAAIQALATERAKAMPITPLLNNFVDGHLEARTSASSSGTSLSSSNNEDQLQSPQKKSELTSPLRAPSTTAIERLSASIPKENKETILSAIKEASETNGVPEDLMLAIAKKESQFNPFAKNPKSSASGLFQQINSTAKNLGVEDRFDVKQASMGAGKHLSQLLKQFNGDEELAVMAYYGGPEIVQNALKAGRRNILIDDVPFDAATNNPGPDGYITFKERVERAKNMNAYAKDIKKLLEQ